MTGRNDLLKKFSLLLSAVSIAFIVGAGLRASHPNISLYDRNYSQIDPIQAFRDVGERIRRLGGGDQRFVGNQLFGEDDFAKIKPLL